MPGLTLIVSLLAVWISIVAASFVFYSPLPPVPADAEASVFSAVRASSILKELVGDGIPHPTGSDQNRIVRQRIIGLLESWGYEVEIQSGLADRRIARPGDRDEEPLDLFNLIAIRKGQRSVASAAPLMLVAHHDSVPAGPGASDDGVGVAAVLEIARMLADEPPCEHDVVFLITDGEEYGLLGAELFVREHPLANQVGFIVNVEARGTTGPSIMFETSPYSGQLVPLFARAVRKPLTSSLFFEIYQRMPNDTDFSVLRRKGMLGFNLAFIGNVRNYHSPQDNYENVDLGSLQHHGENMLGILRTALADEALAGLLSDRSASGEPDKVDPRHEAVYFDIFGLGVIWWPMSWTLPLVGGIAIICLLAMWQVWQRRDRQEEPQSAFTLLQQIPLLWLCFLISAAAIWGIRLLVQLAPETASPWPREPLSIGLGYWLIGLAVIGWMSVWLQRWISPAAMWIAAMVTGLLLAVVCGWLVPGASYLLIVPLAVAGILSLSISLLTPRATAAHGWLLAVAMGLIWLPLDRLFYDAVGFGLGPLLVGRIALVSTAALCVLASITRPARHIFAVATTIAATAAIMAGVVLNLNS